MTDRITLRRYLYFEAMAARTEGTSGDLREVVDTLVEELTAQGWDESERRTWEQWKDIALL